MSKNQHARQRTEARTFFNILMSLVQQAHNNRDPNRLRYIHRDVNIVALLLVLNEAVEQEDTKAAAKFYIA